MSVLFTPSCQRDLLRFNFDDGQYSKLGISDLINYNNLEWESSNSSTHSDSPKYFVEDQISEKVVSKRNQRFCKICNKLFERPSTLKTHMNSHTGDRPFLCPNPSCDRRFSVRSNMNRHYRKCLFS